MKSIGVVIMSL